MLGGHDGACTGGQGVAQPAHKHDTQTHRGGPEPEGHNCFESLTGWRPWSHVRWRSWCCPAPTQTAPRCACDGRMLTACMVGVAEGKGANDAVEGAVGVPVAQLLRQQPCTWQPLEAHAHACLMLDGCGFWEARGQGAGCA